MADHPFTGTLSVTDKIGIGTESPIAKLHIFSSTAAPSQAFLESGGALLKLGVDASGATLGTDNAFPLSFLTNGSSQMAIDPAGNVGMSGALTVQKTLIVNGSAIVGTDTTPANLTVKGTAIATAFQGQSASFQNNLTVNGKVGIGTTSFPQQLNITGGIGFANQNAVDKKLYSPADGVLEWMTHELAGQHGFAVSHQGDRRVFLNTNGNSHFNGGNVGIGTNTPTHKFHVVANDAVGLLESSGNQAYLRLSTNEGFDNRVEITNRPGGRFTVWTAGAGDGFNITKDGSVGIGTNTPTHKFHVVAYDAVGLLESSGNQAYLRLSTNEGFDNRVEITNRPGGRFTVWTAGAGDGFNITKDGNVGIGTLTPSEKLDVAGNLRIGNSLYVTNLPYADRRNVQWDDRTKQFCYDNSSQRSKENITPLADEFTKLLAVEPKTYTRPDFPDTWEIGYIAEEFHDLGLDKLVYYNEDGSPGGINYPKIGLYLLEILKKHEQKFREYEEKIDRLEQQLSSS
jgi:Chaperone of endosialidase